MEKYHKITEMLENELGKIASDGKLTTSSLEIGDKTAHFLKSLKTIEAMEEAAEEEEYSHDYDGYPVHMNRNSYARGRGSRAKRDSMGRYSSKYDGYSRNAKKADLMQEIEMLKEQVENMED